MSESYKLQASPEMMANATEGLELTEAEIRVMENVKDIHENLQKNKADNQLLSLRKGWTCCSGPDSFCWKAQRTLTVSAETW